MTVDQFPPSHKAWDYTAAIHPNFYTVLYQIFKISQPPHPIAQLPTKPVNLLSFAL